MLRSTRAASPQGEASEQTQVTSDRPADPHFRLTQKARLEFRRVLDYAPAVPQQFNQHLGDAEKTAMREVNCFEGFSTFQARPLLNIHDVVVHKDYRGQGVSGLMLQKVAELARQRNCCKLTLEVLQNNPAAQAAYRKAGFQAYQLDPQMGQALFWEKKL